MVEKKVLVIDDDDDFRESIADLLRLRGYQVEVAEDGREALDRVDASMPGVILLDMRMPVMNGWEFARAFRAKHGHPAPIVVISAAADAQKRASEIGAEDWLGKPFDSHELFAAVDRNLSAG